MRFYWGARRANVAAMKRAALLALVFAAACTNAPDLSDRIPTEARDSAPPALVPLSGILAQSQGPAATEASERANQTLAARARALANRARGLRSPVLTPAQRATLRGGVATRGL